MVLCAVVLCAEALVLWAKRAVVPTMGDLVVTFTVLGTFVVALADAGELSSSVTGLLVLLVLWLSVVLVLGIFVVLRLELFPSVALVDLVLGVRVEALVL